MLSGWTIWTLGLWALLNLTSRHSRATTTSSPTETPCMKNISTLRHAYITSTEKVKTTKRCWYWAWSRCTHFRYQIATRSMYKMGVMTIACNATVPSVHTATVEDTVGNGSDFTTENGTISARQGDNFQPTSGQMAGAIIGLIAIIAVIIAAIVGAVIFVRRRRKRKQKQSDNSPGSRMELTSSPPDSAGASMYYVGPEEIRERKQQGGQKDANQIDDESTNELSPRQHVTGSDQTEYSYNHLRETARETAQTDAQENVLNTYSHVQSYGKTSRENSTLDSETDTYYNCQIPGETSGEARGGADMTYDKLEHPTTDKTGDSCDISSPDYDHVRNNHNNVARKRSTNEYSYASC